ncbi:MAG: MarR family transcriptional regulator [Rhodococcus sp.]|nr:MarR family transcriptional regulator [Rhodococcus sp. (in: high G+C Gram-positive bacteria)]
MSTSTHPTAAQSADPDELRHFVEQLSLVLVAMGFPPMPARVWAAMMADEAETTTPGELSTGLNVSPAAISGALRYLGQVGLIERVPMPGSRRQHYSVSAEMWTESFMKRQSALGEFSKVAEQGLGILGEHSVAGERIAEVRDFFDFIAGEMPRMLEEWRASRNR